MQFPNETSLFIYTDSAGKRNSEGSKKPASSEENLDQDKPGAENPGPVGEQPPKPESPEAFSDLEIGDSDEEILNKEGNGNDEEGQLETSHEKEEEGNSNLDFSYQRWS